MILKTVRWKIMSFIPSNKDKRKGVINALTRLHKIQN